MITKQELDNLNRDSELIANAVANTNSDYRYMLYEAISVKLINRSQGYSGRLFKYIAEKDKYST